MAKTWEYAITQQGLALLAGLNGKTLKITTAKVSKEPTNQDLETLTELTDIVQELDVVQNVARGGVVELRLRLDNDNVLERFNVYQVGVYAKSYVGAEDPDESDKGILIQVWQTALPDVIPTHAEEPGLVKDYKVTVNVSGADNVVVNLNKAAYVTYPEFEELKESMMQINDNLIINPDFRVNQMSRYNVGNCTDLEYQIDQWYFKDSDPLIIENWESLLSGVGAKFKNNTSSNAHFILGQFVESIYFRSYEDFAGSPMTLTFKYKGNIKETKVRVKKGGGSANEVFTIPAGIYSDWQDFRFSFTIPSSYGNSTYKDKAISIEIESTLASGKSISLKNFKLEYGSEPTKYTQRMLCDEISLVQSYFELISHAVAGYTASANTASVTRVNYQTMKAAMQPNITIVSKVNYGDHNEVLINNANLGKVLTTQIGGGDGTEYNIISASASRLNAQVVALPTATYYGIVYWALVDCRLYDTV